MIRYDEDSTGALEAKTKAQWIAFAPSVFQAARCLRDLGILSAIEQAGAEGLTQQAIVAQVKLPEYGVRVLLEAGLGIGLVLEAENRYRLTKTAWHLLHDPMTRANLDFSHEVTYLGLHALEAAIRDGKPQGLKTFGEWPTIYQALAQLPEKTRRAWFAFDHFYSDQAFSAALPLVFERKPGYLLDIGGNTGKWALACLRHDSDVHVSLLDLPGQLPLARQLLNQEGFAARARFHELDLLEEAAVVPGPQDAIWMSQFLDCFSEPQIVSILRRCARALSPRGRIYILEPFWDRQRFEAAAFCLQQTSLYFTAMANGNSQIYRSTVFLKAVQAAGLEVENQHDGLGISHTLLVCKNPQ